MSQFLNLEEFNFEWRILDDGEIQLWDGNNYATYSEIQELSEWLILKIGENMAKAKKTKKTLVAKPINKPKKKK